MISTCTVKGHTFSFSIKLQKKKKKSSCQTMKTYLEKYLHKKEKSNEKYHTMIYKFSGVAAVFGRTSMRNHSLVCKTG